MRISLLPPMLLAAAALSACATAPSAAPPTAASLAGSQWRFIAIDGVPPVAGDASLEFHPDRIGAKVGCNGVGGTWRVEGGKLIAGPLVSTQMWCEGRMEQERAVSELLSSEPALTVDGDRLSLKTARRSAELQRR